MDAAQKAKLGQKWTCYSCATRFYDLMKPEPLCPKCQADQRESPLFEKAKPKRTRKKTTRKKVVKKKVEAPPEEEEMEADKVDEIALDDVDAETIEVESGSD